MIKQLKPIKEDISRIEFNISLYDNFKNKQHKLKDIFITTFKFIFRLVDTPINSDMIKQLKPIKDNINRIEFNISLYDNFKQKQHKFKEIFITTFKFIFSCSISTYRV